MPDPVRLYGYSEGGVFKVLAVPGAAGGVMLASDPACCCGCEDIRVIRLEYHLYTNCCCGDAESLPGVIVATCEADPSVSVWMYEGGTLMAPASLPAASYACAIDDLAYKLYVAYLCVKEADYAGLCLPGHSGPTFSVSVPGHELTQESDVMEVRRYIDGYWLEKFNESFCNCHSYRESGDEYDFTDWGRGNGVVKPCDSLYRIAILAAVVVPPCAASCPDRFDADATSVGANGVPDGAITVHVSGEVEDGQGCRCRSGYQMSCSGLAMVSPDVYNQIAGDPDNTGTIPISFRIPDPSSPGSYATFQVIPVIPRPDCSGIVADPTHEGSVVLHVPEGEPVRHVFQLQVGLTWMHLDRDLTEEEYLEECWFPDAATASGTGCWRDDEAEREAHRCDMAPPDVTLVKETWAEAYARQDGHVRTILYSGCAELVTPCPVDGCYVVSGFPPGNNYELALHEIVDQGSDACELHMDTEVCDLSGGPCDPGTDSNDSNDGDDSNDSNDSNDIAVVGHCGYSDWLAIPSVTYAFATNTCDRYGYFGTNPSIPVPPGSVPTDVIGPFYAGGYVVPGGQVGAGARRLCEEGVYMTYDELDSPLWLRPPPKCGVALADPPGLGVYSCEGGPGDNVATLLCNGIDLVACDNMKYGEVYVYETRCPVPVPLIVKLGDGTSCGCCDFPGVLRVLVNSPYGDSIPVNLEYDGYNDEFHGDVMACADDLDADFDHGTWEVVLPDGLECYGDSGVAYAEAAGGSIRVEFPCACGGSEFGLRLDGDGCHHLDMLNGRTLSVDVMCGQDVLATVSSPISDLDTLSYTYVSVPSVCRGCDGGAVPSLRARVLDGSGDPVSDGEADARWDGDPSVGPCGMYGDIVVLLSGVSLSTVSVEASPWDQQTAAALDAAGRLPSQIVIEVEAEYPGHPEMGRMVAVSLGKDPSTLVYSGTATIEAHFMWASGRVYARDQEAMVPAGAGSHIRIDQASDYFTTCDYIGRSFIIGTTYRYQ